MKTKSPSPILMLALAAIMALIVAPATQAALTGTVGYSIDNPSPLGGNYIIGFQFTPKITFDISALGYWDKNHDGLASDHQVAIYYTNTGGGHTAGDLVVGAFTTVQIADSGATLDIGNNTNGWFAYSALASNVTLQAGVQYSILTTTNGTNNLTYDDLSYEALVSHTNDPKITTQLGLAVANPPPYGPNVFFTSATDATNFYSTPNFLIAAPVPEPGSLALLSISGLAFVSWRVRRGMRKSS
ncbi:MAG: PEP-CTERM sorting domain-containing protein [Chthoniobacterales bacterium]